MDKEAARAPAVTPQNMSELILFLLAFRSYVLLRGEDDSHTATGKKIIHRYRNLSEAGFARYFGPLIEGGSKFSRFKPLYHRSMLGSPLKAALAQGEFLSELLPLLSQRATVLKETFSDSRAVQIIRKAGLACHEEDHSVVLRGIALVPSAAKLQVPRAWIREASALAEVSIEPAEEVLAASETAQAIGEELREVEAHILQVDPLTEEGVALRAVKEEIIDRIDSVASESNVPSAVFGAAAGAAAQPKEYRTATGSTRKLLPDKESAMMIRGRGIIAAGAGAGKTMTLASKVVYHINELGVPASSVIATSFSRKSAAELRKRIEKYGASLGNKREAAGFGTTHSVVSQLMQQYGKGERKEGLKDYGVTTLVRLAMEQVQMEGGGTPPEAMSLFAGLSATAPTPAEVDSPDAAPGIGLTFLEALQLAAERKKKIAWNDFLYGYLRDFFDPRAKWHRFKMRSTKNMSDPRRMNDKNKGIMESIFRYTGVDYDIWNPEQKDPNLSGTTRTGAEKNKKRDKDKGLREKHEFFSRPAREWFNLGLKLTREGSGGDETPIPIGEFKGAITKMKGKLISPTEAYHDPGYDSAQAAVYAAYEWLKGPYGEADFQNHSDFDDVLIDMSKMMLRDPEARKKIQARFRVLLIDEAQDLNRAQHLMFGLMAGFIDPNKVDQAASVNNIMDLANEDGSMTADTFCFIGDDKQAIYEFRGADPEAFVGLSDLVEDGAGFETHVLETNFRSGKLIVDAANRLIAFNTRQIPMTCKANPERADEGGIKAVSFPPVEGSDFSEAASWVADHIQEQMESGAGNSEDAPSYNAFGVGLRTNGEAMAYGLELIQRGVPFRSKINFFSDRTTKALLGWLTIADEGINGNPDRINAAVSGVKNAPVSMLGKTFVSRLGENATGNFIEWLQSNGPSIYGPRSKWTQNVKDFTENLVKVAGLKGSGMDAKEILHEIFQLQGFDGTNIKETLVDAVRGDKDRMAELMAASPGGMVSEGQVEEEAMASIGPLLGLLESRTDLPQSMEYVRQLERINSKLAAYDDPDNAKSQNPAVTLGTMHSWKGLEVPNMYIPMVGGRFPRFDKTSEEELASERRLAYVAITRGEDNVFVLDIPTARTTKQGVVIQRSQFIDEMCIPSLSAEARVASAEGEDTEMRDLAEKMDALIDVYLASGDANPPEQKLSAAWGSTLYGIRGER